MWPVLNELNEKYQLGAELTESDLTVKLANGSRIVLFGADIKNFIRRLRGIKTPFAAIDEAQAFGSHLTELIDDILTPAIADYSDGSIALTGTPGPVPKGIFFEASQSLQGFSTHRWSVLENPYMPNPKAFLDDLKKRKGWDEAHPTYRREWLGEWVTDLDALVYKYSADRNLVEELPKAQGSWKYILGIDLGFDPDPCAFVLCAYNEYSPKLYVVQTYKQNKMLVADVAERIKYITKELPYCKMVVDAGALGKMIVEELKQRYQLPLEAADKRDKAGFIELMNSDLVNGKVQVLKKASQDLCPEWETLQWDSDSDKRIENQSQPNNLADAALYAWRYAYNYVFTKFEEKPKPGTEEELDAFWEKESEALEIKKDLPFWERDY
jgi:hypothetical protein